MNLMDFYFNEKQLELIITGTWILIGIILLILNAVLKKDILKIIGIGCLVTSISIFVFTNIYSLFSSNFYVKLPFLAVLGFAIYFSVKKLLKLDKIDSAESNESKRNL